MDSSNSNTYFFITNLLFFGHTDDMKCNWEDRGRWECSQIS